MGTRDNWPAETPDECVERVRREHGDDIADLVARELHADRPRLVRSPMKVGRQLFSGRRATDHDDHEPPASEETPNR